VVHSTVVEPNYYAMGPSSALELVTGRAAKDAPHFMDTSVPWKFLLLTTAGSDSPLDHHIPSYRVSHVDSPLSARVMWQFKVVYNLRHKPRSDMNDTLVMNEFNIRMATALLAPLLQGEIGHISVTWSFDEHDIDDCDTLGFTLDEARAWLKYQETCAYANKLSQHSHCTWKLWYGANMEPRTRLASLSS